MKGSHGIFNRHRRAFSIASLGLTALVLVACGTEDEEDPAPEPTAPVEETVATGAPTEADEATVAATAAVESAAATPAVIAPDEASPVASPVVAGDASPVAVAATPVAAVTDDAAATPAAATPVGAMTGPDVATPVAATPVTGAALSTPVATPIDAIATPAEEILAVGASPVASPMASPVDATPAASGGAELDIPVVFIDASGS